MKITALTTVLLTVGIVGCDGLPFIGGGPDPSEIAEAFWEEMKNSNIDGARQYATATSEFEGVDFSAEANLEDATIEIAPATVSDARAVSLTRLETTQSGMDLNLEFETILVDEDGWKVDADTTLRNMVNSAFQQLLGTTAEEFGEAVGQAFGEALSGAAEQMADAAEQPEPTRPQEAPRPARQMPPERGTQAREIPWTPELVGTISPGMSREEVIATWGEPVTERFVDGRGYMFFRNGCEISCGTYDVVLLEGNQVVDAVVRGPGHEYSGMSSSPAGREPELTLPEMEADSTPTTSS